MSVVSFVSTYLPTFKMMNPIYSTALFLLFSTILSTVASLDMIVTVKDHRFTNGISISFRELAENKGFTVNENPKINKFAIYKYEVKDFQYEDPKKEESRVNFYYTVIVTLTSPNLSGKHLVWAAANVYGGYFRWGLSTADDCLENFPFFFLSEFSLPEEGKLLPKDSSSASFKVKVYEQKTLIETTELEEVKRKFGGIPSKLIPPGGCFPRLGPTFKASFVLAKNGYFDEDKKEEN